MCLGKKRWEEWCYGGEGALGCLELRPDSSSQVWAQCLHDCLPTEHPYLHPCWCHHSPQPSSQPRWVPGQLWGPP